MLAGTHARLMTKIKSNSNIYRHKYFTKHLVGAFRKSAWKSDLNNKSSSFWPGSSRIQSASTCTNFQQRQKPQPMMDPERTETLSLPTLSGSHLESKNSGVKLPSALKHAMGIWLAKPAAVTSSREKSTTANQNLKTAGEN
jgi:hypothetical protein